MIGSLAAHAQTEDWAVGSRSFSRGSCVVLRSQLEPKVI